jgi:hypothetical protein
MPSLIGAGSGAASGAMTGASYGSFFPGIGTGIGAGIGGIVGGLKGLFGRKKKPIAGSQGDPLDPRVIGSQYQNFANTGGYSPGDLANIRSRAVSPIKSIYSGAKREVGRQRALQGGYSPNYTASMAKMAREQSQGVADANIGVESNIAQMVQQGKLQGLEGMSNLYRTDQTAQSDYQRKLNSIGGTTGLIGQIGQGVMGGFGGLRNKPTGTNAVYTPPGLLKQHRPVPPIGYRG